LDNLDKELQTFDDERQMRSLVNAIAFADGFSLLFVRANQIPQQESLINQIKANLPDKHIEVIRFDEPIENLLDELQKRLDGKKPDAIFCYNLNNSFPTSTDDFKSPFVVTLNHSRNSFKRTFECPLVLFLPEFALASLYHGAVDFYSIRSGVYLFAPQAVETDRLITQHISQNQWQLQGLLLEERQNRIETIKRLLDEYQSLPNSQRDIEKEYSLKVKLAEIYLISSLSEKTIEILEDVINSPEVIKDSNFSLGSKNTLALAYMEQGNNDKAELLLNEIIETHKNTSNVKYGDYASTLNNLASVYDSQGKYDEAKILFQESLEIYRNAFDTNHPQYSVYLNNLATVYIAQGNYNGAKKLIEKAIEIDKATIGSKHPEYAVHLSNLATIYYHQKKYINAEKLFQQAIEIGKITIGTVHPDYVARLISLASVYEHKHQYKQALALFEEVHNIRQKTLGENHQNTQNTKLGVERCRQALTENKPTPYKKRKPRHKAKKS
jgi:tetratricopeptide (TPR) repeat protein